MIDPHPSTIDTGSVAAAEISIVEATAPVHRGYTFIHYSSQQEHKSITHIHCHSQSGAKVVLGRARMACCRGYAYSSILSMTAPRPWSLGVQHDNAISEEYIPRLPKPLVYHIINPYRTLLYTMTSYGTTFCGTMSSWITYRILAYEMTSRRMAPAGSYSTGIDSGQNGPFKCI